MYKRQVYNYFTDVKTTDWYAPYVTAAKDAGLIEGYSDGSVSYTHLTLPTIYSV